MRRSKLSLLLPAAALLLPFAARANCGALLAAFDKALVQPRVAIHDIHSRDAPLGARPSTIRIGDVMWDDTGGSGRYERFELEGHDPLTAALRKSDTQGKLKCTAAGSDTFRGTPVTKLKFDNPMVPAQFNPATVWISKSSGLPVYQEVTGLGAGGYAWVYGDAVKEPPARK